MISAGELAFRAARTPAAGALVGAVFARCDWVLPLTKVDPAGSGTGVGLYEHPRPVFGNWHHLLIPKKRIKDLFDLGSAASTESRSSLVTEIGAQVEVNPEIWVCANAGSRQDVGQVHFHLSDGSPFGESQPDVIADFDSWAAAISSPGGVPGVFGLLDQGLTLVSSPSGPGVNLV